MISRQAQLLSFERLIPWTGAWDGQQSVQLKVKWLIWLYIDGRAAGPYIILYSFS